MNTIKKGHTIYNLGDERSIETKKMLTLLARALQVKERVVLLPAQKGDVLITRASNRKALKELAVAPTVSLEAGIKEFANWFMVNKKLLLSLRDIHS
jgi:UDP-glucuronate 4-epimerase